MTEFFFNHLLHLIKKKKNHMLNIDMFGMHLKYQLFSFSQVIPYGVGSLQMRLRRDMERCHCAHRRDTKCVRFCSYLDLQQKWVSLLKSHIVAVALHFTDARLGIFFRDENASVKSYHPRNYKERYKSRFPQRQRRHNPIHTWEGWKKATQ